LKLCGRVNITRPAAVAVAVAVGAGSSNAANVRNEKYMPTQIETKRNWLIALFGLPFFGVGAGVLLFLIVPTLYDGWRMASWPATQGTLLRAELVAGSSDGSTTYRLEARYRYAVAGRSYENDRTAIVNTGDNIGDFQETLGRRLEQALHAERPVTVWYDPENPADAVLNRDIRWGLLGFGLIFVVVFGGVGGGFIYAGLRGAKTAVPPAADAKPWLKRPEWNAGEIRSGAKGGMYFAWVFASIWNLVGIPAAFFVASVWREHGTVALLILIFPLAGLLLLIWAVKTTLEWRRFGATPLTMDPFPGAIGGDVGGEISVDIPYDPGVAYDVTLSCINSYVTGVGKNRSRHEKLVWQDSGYAVVHPAIHGIRLQFRFEVPDGLPESEAHGDNYHLWRLTVRGEMAGVDLDRNFEIPVYRTGEKSQRIAALSARERPQGVPELTAEALLPLTRSGSSVVVHYAMLRKPGESLGILLFGGVFSGLGAFLWQFGATKDFMFYVMGGMFMFAGGAITLAGLYTLFNALHIRFDGRSVCAVRSVLGIPVGRKSAEYRAIQAIEHTQGTSSQSGSAHAVDYSVVAKTPEGDITLAERLDSHSKAETVVAYFEKLTGIGRV
jgi:hypothetical protein